MSELVRAAILAFDQSSEVVGWALVTLSDGDVVDAGSRKVIVSRETMSANYAAAKIVDEIVGKKQAMHCVRGNMFYAAEVAFEGTFRHPKDRDASAVDSLAELRGMCMGRLFERTWRPEKISVIKPRDWQAVQGWNYVKREQLKAWSIARAKMLFPYLFPLDEHACDAIWIGLGARALRKKQEMADAQGAFRLRKRREK